MNKEYNNWYWKLYRWIRWELHDENPCGELK